MQLIETTISDLWVVKFLPYRDERGLFSRLFCHKELQSIFNSRQILQINLTNTFHKGTIRGLHYQKPPNAELKMITCLRGCVYDVAVDLRARSATFLQWHAIELSPDNFNAYIIPEGFAHGFQCMQDDCQLLYLHTAFYSPQAEAGIAYNDARINIKWPLQLTCISERDKLLPHAHSDFEGLLV